MDKRISISDGNLTIGQRYRRAIQKFYVIENSKERQDLVSYQKQLFSIIIEFRKLESIVSSLALFSSNESLREVNSSYLPFVSLPYYVANLLMKYTGNMEGIISEDMGTRLDLKSANIRASIIEFAQYLKFVRTLGGILTDAQEDRIAALKNPYNPSPENISTTSGDPVLRRAYKVSEFKRERELTERIAILNDYYSPNLTKEIDEEDALHSMDEELIRAIYVDQARLYVIKTFNLLETLSLELQVLANRPEQCSKALGNEDTRKQENLRAFDYTDRVEKDPSKGTTVSELINKLGRVLRPFVLTDKREDLRKKVFGTGQILPSMSVEEYLDYELANGKMLLLAPPNSNETDESDVNSDEELRQREWDDWRDNNPKGSGNMMANLG